MSDDAEADAADLFRLALFFDVGLDAMNSGPLTLTLTLTLLLLMTPLILSRL